MNEAEYKDLATSQKDKLSAIELKKKHNFRLLQEKMQNPDAEPSVSESTWQCS